MFESIERMEVNIIRHFVPHVKDSFTKGRGLYIDIRMFLNNLYLCPLACIKVLPSPLSKPQSFQMQTVSFWSLISIEHAEAPLTFGYRQWIRPCPHFQLTN